MAEQSDAPPTAAEPPIEDHGGTRAGLLPRGRQWWLVGILTLLSMLAMLDKNLIQLMVAPIKQDLGLSDVQISMLIGAAFAIANIGAGLPAGWLADRVNRTGLIGAGVLLWSAATAASGGVRSFGGLFAARAAVGFGEGLIPPACYSLLRDGIHPSMRGRAFAIYSMATTAGAGVALIVCGALIGLIESYGVGRLPFVGGFHPWQIALMVIGVLGMPLALLLLTLPKVGRGETGTGTGTGVATSTFADALRFIRGRPGVFFPLLAYSLSHSMLMASLSAWVPALIGRKFGLSPQELGPILGVLLILCGPGGLVIVGILIDRLNRARRPGAAIVGLFGAILFAAAATIMPQIPSLNVFWPVEVIVLLSTTPFLVVTASIVAQETPSHMVGKVMAIFLFVQGLAGPALAPTLAAMLSDYAFAGRPNALGDALSCSALVYGSVALTAVGLLWRNLAGDLTRRAKPAMLRP